MRKLAGIIVALLLASCSASAPPKNVAVIGDSITFLSTETISTTLQAKGYHVTIKGVSGARADEMQTTADSMAVSPQDQVVINLGTNDVNQHGWRLEDTGWQVDTMKDKFDAKCVHLVTITESTMNEPSNNRAAQLNTWMRSKPDVKVVDWAQYIRDHPQENLTTDLVHPSQHGQQVLANLILNSLETC